MEHREHERFEAGVEATVEHPWLGVLNARIRDVSASGVFVELPPRADLHPIAKDLSRSRITVRYRLPRGLAGRPCVWRGFVARTGDSGFGATISDPRPGGDPNLTRLVDYARRTEARRREIEGTSSRRSH